jgi:hypothetical protein
LRLDEEIARSLREVHHEEAIRGQKGRAITPERQAGRDRSFSHPGVIGGSQAATKSRQCRRDMRQVQTSQLEPGAATMATGGKLSWEVRKLVAVLLIVGVTGGMGQTELEAAMQSPVCTATEGTNKQRSDCLQKWLRYMQAWARYMRLDEAK